VLDDLAVHQLLTVKLERGKCADLVRSHEAAIPDDVGGKDGCEAAHNFTCRDLLIRSFQASRFLPLRHEKSSL
jgi:hypothetical protein